LSRLGGALAEPLAEPPERLDAEDRAVVDRYRVIALADERQSGIPIVAENADSRGHVTCLIGTQSALRTARFLLEFSGAEARELSAIEASDP
jgi:hypothetical protein